MAIFKRWWVAIALFFAMLLDGTLSAAIHPLLSHGSFKASCSFVVIGVIMLGLMDDMNFNEVWLSCVIGILADMYYLGFLGIYAVGLPVLCWLSQRIARFLPEVFWMRLIVTIVFYVLFNIYVWLILTAVGIVSVPASQLMISLLANAVWCIPFTIISYPLWYWLARNHPFLEHFNNY